MGQLRNEDGVTINEITVSHRALKNSPHDAVTWDRAGIRGVNIDGKLWAAGPDTVIHAVNVTFDGVSVQCGPEYLGMLADKEFRGEFVAKVKAAHAEQEAREKVALVPHDWQKRLDRDAETDGNLRHWQCSKCEQWVAVKVKGVPDEDEARVLEVAADIDAGKGPTGCLEKPPALESAKPTEAHDWQAAKDIDEKTPDFRNWQCSKCKEWMVLKVTGDKDTAPEFLASRAAAAAALDAGKGTPGCLGIPDAKPDGEPPKTEPLPS